MITETIPVIKSTLNFITVLFVTVALLGCEGQTTREWYVQNDSSRQLTIYADMVFYSNFIDTVIIAPYSADMISFNEVRGGQDYAGPAVRQGDSVDVVAQPPDSLTKDIINETNWLVETDHKRKIPSFYYHRFTFVVSNADFH